jgi:D-inositol-3-phosphate glycosyltransferase
MIFVQPYMSWEGHYKIYTQSLFKNDKDYLVCINDNASLKKKNIFLKKPFIKKYNKNIFLFIFSRITNYILCLYILCSNTKKFEDHKIHFLEFEPISIFVFFLLNFILKKKIYITVHSTNLIKNKYTILFFFQRIIFYIVLLLLNLCKSTIIVHKNEDKNRIKKFFKKDIYVFDYPSPKLNFVKKKFLSNNSLLIIGQIRDDKNFEELVNLAIINNFQITVAGRIMYNKNYWYTLKKNKKIKLIDRYLSIKKIKSLIKINDYIFLPYGVNYSGSAGPLKDSLSYGQPVLCSNLDQFRKILSNYKIGYVFSKKNINKIKKIKKNEYQNLRNNCVNYVMKNNFNNFYKKMKKFY